MPLKSYCPICERRGCDTPADGVLAVDVELVFELNGNRFLHHVTDIMLCAAHAAFTDAAEVLKRDLPAAVLNGVKLDTARVVLMPLAHPDAKLGGELS